MTASIGVLDNTKTADAGKCLQEGHAAIAKSFSSARASSSRKPKVDAALKRYQIRLMTALDSVMPKAGESQRDWDRRLNQLEQEVDAAANEVRIEQ